MNEENKFTWRMQYLELNCVNTVINIQLNKKGKPQNKM